MKQVLLVFIFSFLTLYSRAQNAAINTDGSNADASAMLDVKSTSKGFLMPRLTTAQRTAILLPAKGLKVFDTDTNSFWFHNGLVWVEISAGKNQWIQSGDHIFNSNSGNVGIGTNTPASKLSVVHDGTGLLVKSTAGYSNINIDAANNEPQIRWFRNGVLKWDLHSTNLFLTAASFGLREEGFGYRLLVHGGTGNVSIGRDNAEAKLHVGGTGLFEGSVTIGSQTQDFYKLSVTNNNTANSGIVSRGINGAQGIITIAGDNSDATLYLSNRSNIIWIMQNDYSDNNSFQIIENGRGSRIKVQSITGNVGIDTDNPTAKLEVTGDVKVTQLLTVDDGKGIVRSSNSNQLKMHYVSGNVEYNNVPAGFTGDVTFGYPDIFTGIPRVSMANVANQTGTFERWILTIHSVDTTAKTFKVRFYNASSGFSSFSGTYYFLLVGASN